MCIHQNGPLKKYTHFLFMLFRISSTGLHLCDTNLCDQDLICIINKFHAYSCTLLLYYNLKQANIYQVHGGTTEEDIEKFIKKAENEAEQNRMENMDTVVFFDEANTTDAIGLIKEIMCDRRIHGKSVSEDLKFIAACNPYRRLV